VCRLRRHTARGAGTVGSTLQHAEICINIHTFIYTYNRIIVSRTLFLFCTLFFSLNFSVCLPLTIFHGSSLQVCTPYHTLFNTWNYTHRKAPCQTPCYIFCNARYNRNCNTSNKQSVPPCDTPWNIHCNTPCITPCDTPCNKHCNT